MVKVAVIDGIKIYLYNDEHPPPHFHAVYAEHEAMIDIETLEITSSIFPPRTIARCGGGQRHDAQTSCGSGRIAVLASPQER